MGAGGGRGAVLTYCTALHSSDSTYYTTKQAVSQSILEKITTQLGSQTGPEDLDPKHRLLRPTLETRELDLSLDRNTTQYSVLGLANVYICVCYQARAVA